MREPRTTAGSDPRPIRVVPPSWIESVVALGMFPAGGAPCYLAASLPVINEPVLAGGDFSGVDDAGHGDPVAVERSAPRTG
jgi:hypothetical protein